MEWCDHDRMDWWDQVSQPDFPDVEFRQAFRMSRATFDMICKELEAIKMEEEEENTTTAIPLQLKVAVCIWRLATGEPLRLVSKKFGLKISTCQKLVMDICFALRDLIPKFLRWPDSSQLSKTESEFKSISGIPNLCGSMYTSHIPMIIPKYMATKFYNERLSEKNQQPSHSITVQGVTDCRGIFTDVSIGWPASYSNEKILESSALYQTMAASGLLGNFRIAVNLELPLTDWVLIPYRHQNLTWIHKAFNEKLDSVLKISKEAFHRLKGRWACLQKRKEVLHEELPVFVCACCVLHNICEINGDEMSSDLRFEDEV